MTTQMPGAGTPAPGPAPQGGHLENSADGDGRRGPVMAARYWLTPAGLAALARHQGVPGAGPVPTLDEIRAARERLALPGPDPDQRTVTLLAARLVQLATAAGPEAAEDIAEMLAACVQVLADRHAGCTVLGCGRCLRLADAGAIAAAWGDGRA